MKSNAIIAIASGKGGTGKTSLAVNLASLYAVESEQAVTLFDLDVEEPNSGIFFDSYREKSFEKRMNMHVPCIDKDLCTMCGKCAEKCNFNALALMKNGVLFLKEMCKSCGRCIYSCKEQAITFVKEPFGTKISYTVQNLSIVEGLIDIGDIHTKELINQIKKDEYKGVAIYDAPPGTTCPMVEAVIDADYVILVTEPTPFGLHDLTLAIEVVVNLEKNFGIVINKSGDNDPLIEDYCREKGFEIIGKIPYSKEIAKRCSAGELYYSKEPFASTLRSIISRCREKTA